ncbi:MAG: hypothetical protein JXJ17_18595 [Anaerolineae bacterium]|nr:hypothetical protein [Anaerolineae bacterium]
MADRYVIRIWFEWGGACLWPDEEVDKARFGYPIDPDRLPLTETTKAKAIELGRWHDTRLNWSIPTAPFLWKQAECERFNREYQEFLAALISELGDDFEIIDAQEVIQEDPDLAKWLDDPDAYWGRRRVKRATESVPARIRLYHKVKEKIEEWLKGDE